MAFSCCRIARHPRSLSTYTEELILRSHGIVTQNASHWVSVKNETVVLITINSILSPIKLPSKYIIYGFPI